MQRIRRAAPARAAVWLRSFVVAWLLVMGASRVGWADDSAAPGDLPSPGARAGEARAIPPAPVDYIVRDDGWIRFIAAPEARGPVMRVAGSMAQIRDELQQQLGKPVLDHVEVRVARDPDELARLAPEGLEPPAGAVGVAYPRSRLVLVSLMPADRQEPVNLDEVLRHELARVALFDASGGLHLPNWFQEGYAVHASGEKAIARARTLWSATLSGRLLGIDELDRGFPEGSVQAQVAFAQSADFVRFLLHRQDRSRFHELIERVSQGSPFDHAMGAAYGAPAPLLEIEWREGVEARYSYMPMFLGAGVLWLAAFAFIGVNLVRRRRLRRALATQAQASTKQRPEPVAHVRAVRVLLTPRPLADSVAAQAAQAAKPEDIPKVRHDGHWHTLH